MSGWNKWGIRRKLFSVILLILVLNIVVLVYMGSALFEWFYQINKVSELENSAKLIRAAYEQNSGTVYDEISAMEDRNAQVSLFSVGEDGALLSIYLSRPSKFKEFPKGMPASLDNMERIKKFEKAMVARLQATDDGYNIEMSTNVHDSRDESITLSTRLDDNFYLYIQTPRGYIKSTADLAVQYTAYLSIGILLVGSIAIYFVVGRVTKPIQRIRGVTNRIYKMDFSERCVVAGGDEIAALATDINNMSDALQASIEKLVQANEVLQNDLVRQQQTDHMRQQFVANVSHDFKTPLTLIISYAESLAERTLTDEERDAYAIIIGEGNKLSEMVGRLLQLSKLESGVDRAEKSIFCLSEVLDEVVKHCHILAAKRGVAVTRAIDDEFIVSADYTKIRQAVENLYENALKYTPENGRVTISARRTGDHLCRVAVENMGDPIAADDIDSLFESFYRADKSRAAGQSYGLGLAIVKVVMEAHNQPYGVENTPTGVRFWLQLELADLGEDAGDTEDAGEIIDGF